MVGTERVQHGNRQKCIKRTTRSHARILELLTNSIPVHSSSRGLTPSHIFCFNACPPPGRLVDSTFVMKVFAAQ